MPTLPQVSFAAGEISPSLYARVDLARYAIALRTCKNFEVRPTGGARNRAGTKFVAALSPVSEALLVPFIFSTEQTYMLVFQDSEIEVYSNGSFVTNGVERDISNVVVGGGPGPTFTRTITTTVNHGYTAGQYVNISGVIASGAYNVNGNWIVLTTPTADTFTIKAWRGTVSGSYTSGGVAFNSVPIASAYLSADLIDLRYTQSADVLTIAHHSYQLSEFVREAANSFTFSAIADLNSGPFLETNESATTMTASANTGTGITITASAAVFVDGHVGALIRIDLENLSGIPPWEASKLLVTSGNNPLNLLRRSNGKVYRCATNQAAGASGTYTGTVRPAHEEGTEEDGDGNAVTGLSSRSGVAWEYLHSLFGVARITAVAVDGLSCTADVISYLPTTSATASWAFGAWSDDQGYPSCVSYFGDRLVAANTPEQPQTQWASVVGAYHDFGTSNPLVDDDAITQTLNAKQVNAIVEMIPLDQLISLTSSSSWASPRRGETWTPTTIGFEPQQYKGSADMRAVIVGEYALFVQREFTKLRELRYAYDSDKYGGDELTVLSRHLFEGGLYIVDIAYAEEPDGIVWIVRNDGALIGMTYLPEQQVIAWHRHHTDGFFERVGVIPEDGRDAVYLVVRREVEGATVRYLERMESRDVTDAVDGFFVDSGLTYDGRNTNESIQMGIFQNGTYQGGEAVTVTCSNAVFLATDVGDVVIVGGIRIEMTDFVGPTAVNGILQSDVPIDQQGAVTTDWAIARDTFSGLDHLEGRTVTICADGEHRDDAVVENGQVTLAAAYAVVHIGLGYVCDLETLEVTIPQGNSIRERAKIIPKVNVQVQNSVGMVLIDQAGNEEPLQRTDDGAAVDPLSAYSGIVTGHPASSWNNDGRIFIRQPKPLPCTVLAIMPQVEIGGDG